ncbi:MAG: ATP-binding cassette domain-containing protein [Phycisphaera sp.]|nr:ATP-binding cassette domain-containing protein [Phycisphaera sp.]
MSKEKNKHKGFWPYLKYILFYRRLLMFAGVAALIDAGCAFAGYGALIWVTEQFLGQDQTIRSVVVSKLTDPTVVAIIGDHSDLAHIIPADPFNGFVFILAVLLVFALVSSVMRYLHQSLIITATLRTILRLRKHAFYRLVNAPMSLLFTEGVAQQLSKVVRDTAILSSGYNVLLGKSVRSVLIGLVSLAWALIINWKLAGLFVLGGPVVYTIMRRFGKTVRRASRHANKEYGSMLGMIQASLSALNVVKVHQAEGYERRKFNQINRRVLAQEMRARTVKALASPLLEFIGMIGVMVVAILAAYYIFRGSSGAASLELRHDLVKVLIMLAISGASFRPLANLNNDLQEAAGAGDRVEELLKLPVESHHRGHDRASRSLSDGQGPRQPLPRHSRDVVFENVSYRYPTALEPAVRNVSLRVAHGQTIAVVGPNGSGKTTLLSTIPLLLEPTTGRVLIDGLDITEHTLVSLRRQIAMVSQQSVLFEGTLADNIAYGRSHEPMEKIVEAAKQAFAHEFIGALPNGYHSTLGEAGVGLSGGQRQRVCLARAILRDPAILILDEATSQIDSESEVKINQAMASFRKGRTTFIIAHRLSTVVDADLIVVMQDGRILDTGKHRELLTRCEVYRMLASTQLAPAGAGNG